MSIIKTFMDAFKKASEPKDKGALEHARDDGLLGPTVDPNHSFPKPEGEWSQQRPAPTPSPDDGGLKVEDLTGPNGGSTPIANDGIKVPPSPGPVVRPPSEPLPPNEPGDHGPIDGGGGGGGAPTPPSAPFDPRGVIFKAEGGSGLNLKEGKLDLEKVKIAELKSESAERVGFKPESPLNSHEMPRVEDPDAGGEVGDAAEKSKSSPGDFHFTHHYDKASPVLARESGGEVPGQKVEDSHHRDVFAKIGDIKGESLDSKHKEELASFARESKIEGGYKVEDGYRIGGVDGESTDAKHKEEIESFARNSKVEIDYKVGGDAKVEGLNKLDGVDGESTDAKHKAELESFARESKVEGGYKVEGGQKIEGDYKVDDLKWQLEQKPEGDYKPEGPIKFEGGIKGESIDQKLAFDAREGGADSGKPTDEPGHRSGMDSGKPGDSSPVASSDPEEGGEVHHGIAGDFFKVKIEDVVPPGSPATPPGIPIPYPAEDSGADILATGAKVPEEQFLKIKMEDILVSSARDGGAPLPEPDDAPDGDGDGTADWIARKAGKGQQEFLVVKLEEAFISRDAPPPGRPGGYIGETEKNLAVDADDGPNDDDSSADGIARKAGLTRDNAPIDQGMEEAGHKADIARRSDVRDSNDRHANLAADDADDGPDDDEPESSTLARLRPEASVKEMLPGLGGAVPDDLDLDGDAEDGDADDDDTDESEL